MAKSFDELVLKTTTAKVREQGKARAKKYMTQMMLSEIRKLRGMSQKDLASALQIKQPTLSKLEGQSDMQISTLQRMVAALGGRLVVTAEFPDGKSALPQFESKPMRKFIRKAV